AIGLFSAGGVSLGVYSVGGYAAASRIAMGGYAQGHIAIGDAAKGEFVWGKISQLTPADYDSIRATIRGEYPDIWKWILNVFA
ncbi:MAG: transcriptional regulator, partial [Clostridiales bacterium]|nr:transcriptional regulator [Clostridiales bacterium]